MGSHFTRPVVRPLGWALLAILIPSTLPVPARPLPSPDSRILSVLVPSMLASVIGPASMRFRDKTHLRVNVHVATSQRIAKSFDDGATADIVFSDDAQTMDSLITKGYLQKESRRDLLATRLVLAASSEKPIAVQMKRGSPFASAFSGKLAIVDAAERAEGLRAREALDHFGWLAPMASRLLAAKDGHSAVILVERGEAAAAVLYASDLRWSTVLKPVATFPPESHAPIVFSFAVCTTAKPSAADLVPFFSDPDALALYKAAGFEVLPPRASK